MTNAAFCDYFAGVFEKTPWIPAAVVGLRPFASKAALLSAMSDALARAEPVRKLALLQAHPVLGGQEAKRGAVTEHSKSEQAGLGLDRMEGGEDAAFGRLNEAYLERFGFPFIIAVRGQRDRQAILTALRQRFEQSLETERETALAEVVKIAGFRLDGLVEQDAAAALPLTLSLHVLDTASGTPGVGLAFTLTRIEVDEARVPLAGAATDAGGRWALDRATALPAGLYELVFEAGAYQAIQGRDSFYDRIALRFRMQPDGGHYHIPLILSPFGYSTYRGG
ncbi:2-oxo-4-hydroxy-4-carboxy-5-ureidoimidazoline decarboxylase [Acidisoma cellulosilytica]|uniref:2-oxo-4-hydroxy-4-carboxy-5-ureidoimidazoline decarboxylase n=1 Tax=Acidisoma cellulosilyticum TaxID=2802395 RepID=A0A964E3W6_9PROT|nr:2-oxo-4-hydroxy-4-carboxy-5-ureidoimidazoline decarboxylase [Acidisoma cellulosilyticum]MCB8880368.1 2-oxo-4-hydroxy-4-carboxy-5-ureidoimidazoline decarboxylase [Acidisoma cellulosilyticum]